MRIAIVIMSIFLLFSPSAVNAYSIIDVPENRIIDVPELRIIDIGTNNIIDIGTIRVIDIPDNKIILTNNQSIDLRNLGIIDVDTNNPNQNIVTFLEFISDGSIPISVPEPTTTSSWARFNRIGRGQEKVSEIKPVRQVS